MRSTLISIDYDKAIALAKELEEAARMCGESLRNLKTERGNSEACWQGASGDAMRTQMEAVGGELQSVKSQLETIAASIRRAAEELRKKDKELSGIIGRFI